MKARERDIRFRLKTDFAHYAQKCLKIRTKDGRIAPFILNNAQQLIHAAVERQRQEIGRVRAIILKGRQQGCTTYVQGRFYWRLSHQKGCRAFCLTHLDDAARNVHQMMRRFHENCPFPVRPKTGLVNAHEMTFDRLDSSYQVGTARSQGVGRAQTLQFFHGSEVAYWTQAQDHMSGILQAVAETEGTEIILESTSAGAQGLFYQLTQAAAAGTSDYQFIFVPWFLQTEYRRDDATMAAWSPEEKIYQEQHQLTAPQMLWRRYKMQELGGIQTFRREYPATLEEAFAADQPGALWTRQLIHDHRRRAGDVPKMKRVVVAVDPATRKGAMNNETGIIVAGLGIDGHGYVLEDASGRYTPSEWAGQVIAAYHRHSADKVVAEVNQGGDMVEHTLRALDPGIAFKAVHASRGKFARAEPVAAFDMRGLVHHAGIFPALEDQMCQFDPRLDMASPDRVDARVWALTELMLNQRAPSAPVIWGG